MEPCIFCNYEEIKQDIIKETPNFYVKVGFGLTAPGHIMILTKKHYSCFAELPKEIIEEFYVLEKEVLNAIKENFKTEVVELENGVWKQSICHAHMHFIPLKTSEYNIKSLISEMVLPMVKKFNLRSEEVDFNKLKEIFNSEKSYFWIKEKDKSFVLHVIDYRNVKNHNPEDEDGYREFFTKMGVKGVAAWKNMNKEEKILDEKKRNLTKEKLKFNMSRIVFV